MLRRLFFCLILLILSYYSLSQTSRDTIGYGWARTSINTVVFRKNSVASNGNIQYAAYYDSTGFIVVAKRVIGKSNWEVRRTSYHGTVTDAHNSISIVVDGDGYLHMAWDHHNSPLRYCRSAEPGSLELTPEMPMTGANETTITYPEFYRLPDGDLLFLYRSGESGEGNLIVNRYDRSAGKWTQLHHNLIDGQKKRNAYWQAFVDSNGTIHLSWVWRETWDVSTNHDLCYAQSKDGGMTWLKTTGERYVLPINAQNAEYAFRIPENSELINQTSMCADSRSRPYIATYWKEKGNVPQYYLICHDGVKWSKEQATKRTSDFSLKGAGTKKIPISRPQVVIDERKGSERLILLYRDVEHRNHVSVAIKDSKRGSWSYKDVVNEDVGDWEPTYDAERWKNSHVLSMFVQKSGQGDGEKTQDLSAQPVLILEFEQ